MANLTSLPVEVLEPIWDFITADDIYRLWITGFKRIQYQLRLGVRQFQVQFPNRSGLIPWPKILTLFPRLKQLIIDYTELHDLPLPRDARCLETLKDRPLEVLSFTARCNLLYPHLEAPKTPSTSHALVVKPSLEVPPPTLGSSRSATFTCETSSNSTKILSLKEIFPNLLKLEVQSASAHWEPKWAASLPDTLNAFIWPSLRMNCPTNWSTFLPNLSDLSIHYSFKLQHSQIWKTIPKTLTRLRNESGRVLLPCDLNDPDSAWTEEPFPNLRLHASIMNNDKDRTSYLKWYRLFPSLDSLVFSAPVSYSADIDWIRSALATHLPRNLTRLVVGNSLPVPLSIIRCFPHSLTHLRVRPTLDPSSEFGPLSSSMDSVSSTDPLPAMDSDSLIHLHPTLRSSSDFFTMFFASLPRQLWTLEWASLGDWPSSRAHSEEQLSALPKSLTNCPQVFQMPWSPTQTVSEYLPNLEELPVPSQAILSPSSLVPLPSKIKHISIPHDYNITQEAVHALRGSKSLLYITGLPCQISQVVDRATTIQIIAAWQQSELQEQNELLHEEELLNPEAWNLKPVGDDKELFFWADLVSAMGSSYSRDAIDPLVLVADCYLHLVLPRTARELELQITTSRFEFTSLHFDHPTPTDLGRPSNEYFTQLESMDLSLKNHTSFIWRSFLPRCLKNLRFIGVPSQLNLSSLVQVLPPLMESLEANVVDVSDDDLSRMPKYLKELELSTRRLSESERLQASYTPLVSFPLLPPSLNSLSLPDSRPFSMEISQLVVAEAMKLLPSNLQRIAIGPRTTPQHNLWVRLLRLRDARRMASFSSEHPEWGTLVTLSSE